MSTGVESHLVSSRVRQSISSKFVLSLTCDRTSSASSFCNTYSSSVMLCEADLTPKRSLNDIRPSDLNSTSHLLFPQLSLTQTTSFSAPSATCESFTPHMLTSSLVAKTFTPLLVPIVALSFSPVTPIRSAKWCLVSLTLGCEVMDVGRGKPIDSLQGAGSDSRKLGCLPSFF